MPSAVLRFAKTRTTSPRRPTADTLATLVANLTELSRRNPLLLLGYLHQTAADLAQTPVARAVSRAVLTEATGSAGDG